MFLFFTTNVLSHAKSKPINANPQSFAFIHVTIIDATGAPPKRNMTVIIRGVRIATIGKTSTTRLRRNVRAVDATGMFLIPGLWDMHVHIGDNNFDRDAYLSLFVANGVTGIRIMDGLPEHHLWRREIEEGTLLGPRMVIASRIIDGPTSYLSGVVIVSDAFEARQAAQKAKQAGADFLKIHDKVPRDAYFALIKEAKLLGLPVAGHVPESVTALEASNAGQRSIEHLTGLDEAISDTHKADLLLATFKRNHTWNCPTLIMRHNYASLQNPSLINDPRLKYTKASWRLRWGRVAVEAGTWPADEAKNRKAIIEKQDALVGKIQRAGLGILAGTDDGNPYVIPGFSLHDELGLLVGSGLTPLQALQAATINPAKFLKQASSLGTVRKGRLADLVLLNANPLKDIRNTTRIEAVVNNGQYFDRASLDKILRRVEKTAN
ncbi:MAG TPA: amidohydrolase family protein [Pyrinomonadaceae bacterium]|nr:amidohydrolase family protein [Pyrinomonadaceae bacterium]